MPRWRRLLTKMAVDSSPTGYSYAEAANILQQLGFDLAPSGGGSHRKWRRRFDDGRVAIVGLVERPGPMKAYLIRQMVRTLRDHHLLPSD